MVEDCNTGCHFIFNFLPFWVAETNVFTVSIGNMSANFKTPSTYCHSLLYDCKLFVLIVKFDCMVLNLNVYFLNSEGMLL